MESVSEPWHGNSYRFGRLVVLAIRASKHIARVRRMVGLSELEEDPAVPGPPRAAAGGLSCREVHWYRWGYPGRPPSRYCVPVAPIRVAFRRGIYATVVGAGPGSAWCASDPPVV